MRKSPLGNLSVDHFLTEYWQKKPLFIRNALSEISSPIAADILAGLACEEGVESRIVIQNKTDNKWELQHGPFSEETFSALPTSHWTLLVQAVDHWMPQAAKFLEQFNFIPRWRIDDLMVSYAAEGGGVGPHFDNYDVFLVQTNGKRKWEIGEQCDEDSPLVENLPISILSDFKATDTWVLEPGDILYVPPGYGHNGIAVGDDCITCSVGFRAPSHSEILREYTDHVGENISDTLRYNDANLSAQANTGEITQQALHKVRKILQQYTTDIDSISDWFASYMTTPKYSQDTELLKEEYNLDKLKKHLEHNGQLCRNESSRFAYITKDGNHKFFVDGKCIEKVKCENQLIEALCSNLELDNDMLSQTDNSMILLLELLQRGALYIPET